MIADTRTKNEVQRSIDMLAHREEASVDFQFLWRVFRRRWKICSFCGLLLGTLGALVVWLVHKPEFEATAWLRFNASPDHLAYENAPIDAALMLDTQLELVRSPQVLRSVADEPRLVELELNYDELEESVFVRRVEDSELHTVSFSHEQPEIAAFIVNRVVEEYTKLQLANSSDRSERVLALIGAEKQRRYADIERIRDKLRTIFEEHPDLALIVGEEETNDSAVERLQRSLVEAQVEAEVLKAKLATDREAFENRQFDISAADIDKALDSKPQVLALTQLLSRKEAVLAETAGVASTKTDQESVIPQMDTGIKFYYEKLAEMKDRLRPDVIVELEDEAATAMEDDLKLQELAIKRQLELAQRLEEQLDSHLALVSNQDPSLVEAVFLQRELDQAEVGYEALTERMDKLVIETKAPSPVQTVWQAEVPTEPESPLRFAFEMGAVFFAGYWFPFAIAVLIDRGSDRISEPEHLRPRFSLPFVAETAHVAGPPIVTANGSAPNKKRQVFDESVDALWTQLLLSNEILPQTMVISSAAAGEGKTRVAVSLGRKVAQWCEDPVLVIDADLRGPEIHRLFELPPDSMGLGDVLNGDCSAEEAVFEVAEERLSILGAGAAHRAPQQLFDDQSFAELLIELRRSYRFIIIDCPPILSASESLLIANKADGVLMCAMWEKSRGEQVRLAFERLASADVCVIGAVLNGVPTRRYVHVYGHYGTSNRLMGRRGREEMNGSRRTSNSTVGESR